MKTLPRQTFLSSHPASPRTPRRIAWIRSALKSLTALVLLAHLAAAAQVPPMINYQGRILVGNDNFNQMGNFKFALINADGSETYWSNDGTLDGSAPTQSTPINVDHGLFSVVLGDSSLLNMLAIPVEVFAHDDVWLRVWFDDGIHGFEQFEPDQRIVSVGYAMMAGNVPDGLITEAKLADDAVTGDKIAPGSIGSQHIGNNAITSADIANTLTLEQLNLGGISWDGSMQLFAKPSGGGGLGNFINPNGDLRGTLDGDALGSEFVLKFGNSENGARLVARSPGGQLQLWDALGVMTSFLGSSTGGGDLNLFQINGNAGIKLNGDKSTYDNASSSGGEITVHNQGGQIGLVLDGQHNNGGRIEVRNPATGNVQVDILALGAHDAGEIRIKDDNGSTTIVLDGDGGDASLVSNGLLQLGATGGLNLVMDANEITARNAGAEAPLYLNPNQGNVVIGRTTELDPPARLLVESDSGQDSLRVRVGGSTKLYVSGTGQVGVNTTNVANGYELSVAGQIICAELVVQDIGQWPDYVFAADYDLMSLDELESSIQKHRHLPGIPKAGDVEAQGVSLGDMQKKMMEKIEELTLYVLQQNKQLKTQEERIESLRAQLDAAR